MKLTHDARAALRTAGFSRRDFLKTGGALVIGFSTAGTAAAQFGFGPTAGSPSLRELDS